MMQFEKAIVIDVPDLPEYNKPEFCQNCTQWCSDGTRCYNCYPDKISPHNNRKYREKYFMDKLNKLMKIDSNGAFVSMFSGTDKSRIIEVFDVFNERFKGKALPYTYFIPKIADLLNIKHEIEIDDTKRNKEIWQQFLEMKPFEVLKKQNEFDEYMEAQIRATTRYVQLEEYTLENINGSYETIIA